MSAQLILWSHALTALLFGALGLDQLRRGGAGWGRYAFLAGVFATALWALAIAGIDARDLTARVAESMRNIVWLGFMYGLARRDRSGRVALASVYGVVMALCVGTALLAVVDTVPMAPDARGALTDARVLLRMIAAAGALVLVRSLPDASATARGRMSPLVVALAAMWAVDLATYALIYVQGWVPMAAVARGVAMCGIALIFAIAADRGVDWRFTLSRAVVVRAIGGLALLTYLGSTVLLTTLADRIGGDYARVVQTGIVFGSTAALFTLLSTPWLRAWAKVKIAKHLFRHRYDYRTEWQRFADTLGRPGEGAAPLAVRIVKAMADLTDSPAGLLLVADGTGLGSGPAWNWETGGSADEALARHLVGTGRIVELDARGAEAGLVPGWMRERADAWALVPLIHGDALVGAILLARPPVDRALDWEDFDLLRVAGRQAASYLAEDRAHDALADAQRFDEFNRRFAFILHDIKNLVSQLTLVARNAERHADNPDFRADMVATLQDSATRMNALLARLSQHNGTPAEPLQPVDAQALLARVANARRAQHPIVCRTWSSGLALAHPGRLEQVIGHLVQNAIEASAADEAVTLTLDIERDAIVIGVADAGCGMAPAFVRDQLFRPFASTKPGGFGIGAFEARQLVLAMGGSLDVASREGEGTRFRILLPIAPALEAAA